MAIKKREVDGNKKREVDGMFNKIKRNIRGGKK